MGVAWGSHVGRNRLAINTPWGGFGVALGGFGRLLHSSFIILPSTFSPGWLWVASIPGRSRLSVSPVYITRPGWRRSQGVSRWVGLLGIHDPSQEKDTARAPVADEEQQRMIGPERCGSGYNPQGPTSCR
jgi:hypothetical protein